MVKKSDKKVNDVDDHTSDKDLAKSLSEVWSSTSLTFLSDFFTISFTPILNI